MNLFKLGKTFITTMHRCTSSKAGTIDKSEIEFFGKYSHNWWDKNGPVKLLHSLNSLRVPIIEKYIVSAKLRDLECQQVAAPLKGIKLLDVGCGAGILSEPLAQLGADVIGIDGVQHALEIANFHLQTVPNLKENLKFQEALIEDFSVEYENFFDAVIVSEVIEHVVHQDTFVKYCIKCLKPGGSIIFSTMSKTRAGGFYNIFLLEDIFRVIPKGTHQFAKFISPSELSTMIDNGGCKTVDVNGFVFNFLNGEWINFPVTWFCYFLHATKPIKVKVDNNAICKF